MSLYSEVIQTEDSQVVKRLGPFTSMIEAEMMCDSLSRNLDHTTYITQTHESEECLQLI